MTQDVYLGRKLVSPRVAEALEAVLGEPPTESQGSE
jgi:hypothetical protein